MNTSEQINELAASLALFQANMPTLPKDSSGYGYKYTSLDAVVEAIRGDLSANGLSFVQMPDTPPVEFGVSVGLTTRLMHVSGQWLESTLVIPVPQVGKANEAQQYGAALTYARRYALTSMLGVVADEDVDGATPTQAPAKPQPKKETAVTDEQRKPSEAMLKKLWASGNAFYGAEWEAKRKELVLAITKKRTDSSKHLTFDECKKLIDGIEKSASEA